MFVLNNTAAIAGSTTANDAASELQQLELELQRTVRRYRRNLATLQQPEEPRSEDTRVLSSEVVRAFSSNAAQLISCDACGEEMTAAHWRKHRETCSMKQVQCPLPGCTAVVEAGRLKQHFKRDCKVYRKRQQLVQQRLQKQQQQQRHAAASAGSITRQPPPSDSDDNDDDDDDDDQQDAGNNVGGRSQASGEAVKRSSNQEGEESTAGKGDEAAASRAIPQQRICPQCHKHVARSLQDHFMNDCVMVPVQCPNRPLGCDKTLPLFVLQAHLCNDCVGERVKDDMAKRAKERRSMTRCPGCGSEVMVMHLSSHQRNNCRNRKVPCRNWQFGCQRLVRAKDMNLHTMIDAALLPRAFLEFGGADARLVLDEEDVDPPWSVEFWLWRPEIEEELAKRLAEVQLYEKEYRATNTNEAKQHELIMDLTKQLQEAMTRWAEMPSREMESAKNEVMATLSSSVEQYEAAAFETTLSAHHLRLSINASMALVTELGTFEGRFEQFRDRVDAGLFAFDTAPATNDQAQGSADNQNAGADLGEEAEENPTAGQSEHERLDALITRLAGRLIELDREAEQLDKRRVDAGLIRSHESGRMPSSRSTGRARSRNRRRTESAATVAKRIAESIAAKPGVNTLLSSSGGSIMLSAKDNRIGVYSSRTGLQVFNAECAREGWVHVAMVHTAPPNSRLILFLDGIRTAELHNVDLALPMQFIGATANSFVGRICDVRYWGSELAPLEVASGMHQLLRLDEALKEKSLTLWLSCEEGEGRTVADNSDQRYNLSLEGAFRWRRGEDEDLPLPSWRHHNLCQVEVRRVKLAQKGRALWQETSCEECGDAVRKIDMRFHRAHECKVRMVICWHLRCGVKYRADLQAEHEQECEPFLRRKELLESHEQQSQTLPCTLCGQQVVARQLDAHMSSQCIYRLVECAEGCGEKIPFHRLQAHRNFCTAPHMVYRRELVIRSRRRRGDFGRPWSRSATKRSQQAADSTDQDSNREHDNDGDKRNNSQAAADAAVS